MRHKILDILIDDLSDTELIQRLTEWVLGTEQKFITTPNPEFVLLSRKDEEFRKILQSSDLSLPDGVGLRYAIAALTDSRLTNRHTGVDLVETLVRLADAREKRILFLGGDDGSAEMAKQNLLSTYTNAQITIINPGPVSFPISEQLVEQMRSIAPDILCVAFGQKKQEKFIQEILPNVPSIKIAVGIGGAFEMISGQKRRAPKFFRNVGLEWAWRVFIEPQRINRIFNASFVFPLVVISATLKQHRFIKACRNVIPEIYRQLRNV